ncbi:hypothetical protein GCM10027299_23820 [Larkinella ripae]
MNTTELTLTTPHEGLKATLYDSQDRVVLDDYLSHHQTRTLPNGIYTLRADLSGQLEEKTLLLRGQPVHQDLRLPYYSATLLGNIATSHEYYTHDAWQLSLNPTKSADPARPTDSGLLIFLRCSSLEQYRKHYGGERFMHRLSKQFFLLDESLTPVAASEDWKNNDEVGWLGFSGRFKAGLYFLVYVAKENPEESRQIPLYLFEKWQTQVFITQADKPLFSGMRIQMAPIWQGFDNNDTVAFAVDYATDRLQNHRFHLPDSVQFTLLDSKFTNPILGVLWAYSYLLNDSEERDYDLLGMVLGRLENEIMHQAWWPDLQVLRLMANQIQNASIQVVPIPKPPLFNLGMEQLVQLASQWPELVPEDSLTDLITTERFPDSVWTTWHPDPAVVEKLVGKASSGLNTRSADSQKSAGGRPATPQPSWFEISLLKSLANQEKVSLPELATQLGLPVGSAKRLVRSLLENAALRNQLVLDLQQRKLTSKTAPEVLALLNALGQL